VFMRLRMEAGRSSHWCTQSDGRGLHPYASLNRHD